MNYSSFHKNFSKNHKIKENLLNPFASAKSNGRLRFYLEFDFENLEIIFELVVIFCAIKSYYKPVE